MDKNRPSENWKRAFNSHWLQGRVQEDVTFYRQLPDTEQDYIHEEIKLRERLLPFGSEPYQIVLGRSDQGEWKEKAI